MATSGSISFSVSRDDIITEALELLGELAEGQSPSANALTSCSRTLNMMVKNWQAEGLTLSALQRTYLFLEKNKSEYTLTSSGDNWTTSFNSTQIATAGIATDTTIDVSDASLISNGDYIGIELDDGTMQWTTVNGAPVGNTVTLTTALSGASAANNYVYSYTTKANRPASIVAAQVKSTSGTETTVDIDNKTDYITLSNKSSDGQVTQIWPKQEIASYKVYVWPQTSDVTDYLVLWAQRTLEDFTTASDTPDFPQEWYLPLATNLAVLLAPKYGTPVGVVDRIKMLADEHKSIASSFGQDNSVFFSPNFQGSR